MLILFRVRLSNEKIRAALPALQSATDCYTQEICRRGGLASYDGIESLVDSEITVVTKRHNISALRKKNTNISFLLKFAKLFLPMFFLYSML